ncbi:MAG: ModD protein [Candidatus Thiodiazotropha sp.]
MRHTHCWLTQEELNALLREDAPYGDLTTASLGIGQQSGRITFHARDPMIVCGIEEAVQLFKLAGADQVEAFTASGDAADPGRHLLQASGPAHALFLAWKVAQSLMESLAGVSSCARQIVDQAGDAVVACTRKHLPGTKTLMVKAIQSGGATMHRLGLSESIMVTEEHRSFLTAPSSHDYLPHILSAQPEKKCVVEVDQVDQALALIEQECPVIQLEKCTIEEVSRVVEAARTHGTGAHRTVIAAAGGIHPNNAGEYAATGVDLLVTSAPYFAKPRDVQVRFGSA